MRDLWEEIRSLYRWIVKFITEDIWHIEIDDLGRAKRKFLKYLKIAIMTVRESGINKLGLYSVSLSFFVAMSVVPFAAVEFKGKLYAETLEGCIRVKAENAKMEVLNPIGEVIAEMDGEKSGGEIRFAMDGSVPGIQYRLVVNE